MFSKFNKVAGNIDRHYILIAIFISIFMMIQFVHILSIVTSSSEVVSDDQVHQLVKTSNNPINLWMFTVTITNNDTETMSYVMWAKIAVMSALRKTSLRPVLMLVGRHKEFEEWMTKHGVIIAYVKPEQTSIIKYIEDNSIRTADSATSIGTHVRLIIPRILDHLERENKLVGLNSSYILFTDIDIMFNGEFHLEDAMLPRYVAFAIQGDVYCCGNKYQKKYNIAAGVFVLNVTGYRETFIEFQDFLVHQNDHNKKPIYYDQATLSEFYPPRIEIKSLIEYVEIALYHNAIYRSFFKKYYSQILPKTFEWEPYLGWNTEAKIVHWHGPKLHFDSCDLKPIEYASRDTWGILPYLKREGDVLTC